MSHLLQGLVIAAVLGSALVAGIFFAFSSFVMQALRRLPGPDGIAAMQEINVTVLNPWFFLAFLGTGVVCLPIAFLAFTDTTGALRFHLVAGCALYVVGCVLVTGVFNVPLNDRLAEVEPGSPEGKTLWAEYLVRWTRFNHLRTAASLAAAALLIMVL
jgi:uncharacterized membrane protein